MLRFLVLFYLAIGSACATTFPLDLKFEDIQAIQQTHQDYAMLKDLKQPHYGEYWQLKYTFATKQDAKQRFAQMSQLITQAVGDPSLSFERYGYMRFEHAGEEYLMQLKAYAKTANIELLRSSGYQTFLDLGMKAWPLNASLVKKGVEAPIAAIAPVSDEVEIKRLKHKRYDEQTFRASKYSVASKGQYWIIEYGLKNYNQHNSLRYRAAHDYRTLLAEQGAAVHMDGNSDFVFEVEYEGVHYVGKFAAYEKSMSLKVIEEDTFSQTLVLSPDRLKAQLDARGQVTLEGIYFDTDRATLKKASAKAILAAASLMKHYSDLVLEVQGHTDDQGDDRYNLDLSKRRAATVAEALTREGVEASRLLSRGVGETAPVADNGSRQGRAKNRRVELHRISGGDEISMLGIDFIKPLPNARTNAQRHYEHGELTVHHTPPYAEIKKVETISAASHEIHEYVIDRKGKRDMHFSRTEILLNYRNILPMLGARLLGEYQNTLYFRFDDRGDQRPLYGAIKAYDGLYEVQVYTLDPVEKAPSVPPVSVLPEGIACTPSFAGDWRARGDLSHAYNTQASAALLEKMQAVRLELRDDGSMTLGDDRAPEQGQWSIESGKILLHGDPQQGSVTVTCLDAGKMLIELDIISDQPARLVLSR
ncbi:MAG: OmpA family protein [Candidatus Thiodiazotropha sp.]